MILCTRERLNKPAGFVYVLACAGNRFYVGFSKCLGKRLEQHFAGEGAVFTKRFKPTRVLEKKPAESEKEEFQLWKEYAARYGRFRVGGWNRFLCEQFGFHWPYSS